MKPFFHRLFVEPHGVPILLPSHLLFFVSFVFGVAFLFPPEIFGIMSATLYQFSLSIWPGVPMIWGGSVLIATLLNTVGAAIENRHVSSIASFMMFLLWLYTAMSYIISGFYLGLFAIGIPMMVFWGWYHTQLRKTGEVSDV